MHIALPSGNTAHYLAAIDAAAIYIALPRIGAASVRGLRRLPRDAGDIQWMVWVRDLASARTVADPDLIWDQDNGVKRCRPLPELVTAIEQRAHDLSVPLTPHERATERVAMLAQRVDGILTSFRTSGQLKCFNTCYRTYRVKMNGHAPPYHAVLADLRAELIRTLVEVPRGELSAALVTKRVRARFPWYTWYG